MQNQNYKKPEKSYAQLREEIQIEINQHKYKPNPLAYKKTDGERNLLKELKKVSNKTFTHHQILN